MIARGFPPDVTAETRRIQAASDEYGSDEAYHILRYRDDRDNFPPPATSQGYAIKTWETSGDHLHIAELTSGLPTFVRFGRSNPWIRIREGMTLRRQFRRVSITTFDLVSFNQGAGGGYAKLLSATLYASRGPLFVDHGGQAVDTAFRHGMVFQQVAVVASPASTDVLRAIVTSGNPPNLSMPTLGKGGGRLRVQVTGANPAWVTFGSNDVTADISTYAWKLFPATATNPTYFDLPLSSMMISGSRATESFYAAGIGGATTLGVILSSAEQDLTEPEFQRSTPLAP